MYHIDFDSNPIQRALEKNMSQTEFLPIYEDVPEYDLDWLVEGLLPAGYLVMLAGPPKSGKSCLATALALAIATGTPFAGRPTQQSSVLWVAAEESPQERYQILRTSPLADSACPLYTCYNRILIDTEIDLFGLDREIRYHQAKFVVIDPLLGAISGRSLQDSWNARKTLQMLKKLCSQRQVTALVLHHQKQRNMHRAGVADNDQISATASMNIVLQSKSSLMATSEVQAGDSLSRIVTLDCQGRGDWSIKSLKLLSRGPLDYSELTDQRHVAQLERDCTPSELKILNLLRDCPMPSEWILDKTEISVGTIRNAIARLRKRGLVMVARIEDGLKYYGLVDSAK